MFETVALLAPAPDSAPDWPASWAEVPGERFAHDGSIYAVVSVPAGTDDPRIRRDLAPMYCEGGIVYLAVREDGCDVATCPHACPGIRGLFPVELAGREACHREFIYPDPPENNLEGMIEGAGDGDEQEPVVPTP